MGDNKMKKSVCLYFLVLIICFVFGGCNNKVAQEQKDIKTPDVAQNKTNADEVKDSIEISSFTTKIVTKGKDRMDNIILASKSLDGYVIKAGAEFSFNNTVGVRSKERGYKKAMVFFSWGKSYEEGGGICQLSSTLYNTAKNADMQILERHDHLKKVYYLPIGQDAAVKYGSQDLRFINTKSFDVITQTVLEYEKSVTVKFFKK